MIATIKTSVEAYLCPMIQIDDKIVSLEVVQKAFVCDLHACKGACCVEGDSGAPLTEEEVGILKDEYENFKPYLRQEGVDSVEAQGTSVVDDDGDFVTPLRDGKECAYTVFSKEGMAMCGIELAWKEGKTHFRKPISCHLYPIRTKRYRDFEAVNYERWNICSDACTLGQSLKVSVHQFAKEALIRKYGEDWFNALDEASRSL